MSKWWNESADTMEELTENFNLSYHFFSPITKCAPPKTIEDDLRPTSLTPQQIFFP
jgi:hypothetical protein